MMIKDAVISQKIFWTPEFLFQSPFSLNNLICKFMFSRNMYQLLFSSKYAENILFLVSFSSREVLQGTL